MGRTHLRSEYFENPVFRKALTLIKKSKKIIVFGDEDPDGISASSILTHTLNECGFKSDYYVPSRETEGIGLNKERIRQFAKKHYDLIITVDCGSVNHEEIKYAGKLGMMVIVTDHHIPYKGTMKGLLLINPHVLNVKYFNDLSGSGMSLIFSAYIFKHTKKIKTYDETLSLYKYLPAIAGIGTLCDKVKKTPFNKYLISAIKTLPEFYPAFERCIDEACICGIIHGSKTKGLKNPCVDIFLGKKDIKASKKLIGTWKQKRTLYKKHVDTLMKRLENRINNDSNVILLYEPGIASKYTGAVASMITYKTLKPVCIIGKRNNSLSGEARASANFNWVGIFSKYSEYFENWGGHKLAAGFSINRRNVEAFIDRFNADFNS